MGTSGLPDIYTLSPRAAYKCSPNSIWIKAMKALYQRFVQRIAENHLPGQYRIVGNLRKVLFSKISKMVKHFRKYFFEIAR